MVPFDMEADDAVPFCKLLTCGVMVTLEVVVIADTDELYVNLFVLTVIIESPPFILLAFVFGLFAEFPVMRVKFSSSISINGRYSDAILACLALSVL